MNNVSDESKDKDILKFPLKISVYHDSCYIHVMIPVRALCELAQDFINTFYQYFRFWF